jgi:glycerophosphoryl diester phosphodiesterase
MKLRGGGELLDDIFAGADGWQESALIAHAGGGMEKEHYSNSLEAFEDSYQNGMRTIELDFLLTSDDRLVCGHDWNQQLCSDYEEGYVYSYEEFLDIRIFDKYTPLSLERVFELMKKYEDVYVITDTKDSNPEEVRRDFEILLETAQETDSMEVLNRLVIQLYNYEMYDVVEEVYPFSSYVLTLYKLGEFDETEFISHCRFCKTNGIDAITMWYYWATPEIMDIANQYGIDIYVHTLNTVEEMEEYYDMGVKGIYTDEVTLGMLEQK